MELAEERFERGALEFEAVFEARDPVPDLGGMVLTEE